MHTPATYIYIKFNSFKPIVIEGDEQLYESRNFIELMEDYKLRLLSEIKI